MMSPGAALTTIVRHGIAGLGDLIQAAVSAG